jgi:hypothetical protein
MQFIPSCVKNKSKSMFTGCNSEINLCAGCHRRHLGRFRLMLEDSIEVDVKEIRWQAMDWICQAEDRDMRLAVVNTLLYT